MINTGRSRHTCPIRTQILPNPILTAQIPLIAGLVKHAGYYPWELEQAIEQWVEHYNHRRYHESLDNVTPADVFFGRQQEILSRRESVKRRTLAERRRENLKTGVV